MLLLYFMKLSLSFQFKEVILNDVLRKVNKLKEETGLCPFNSRK